MGHGNPDKNYNANTKYTETEEAMQALAANKNVFVGTLITEICCSAGRRRTK